MIPAGATRIDLGEAYVLPGLMDMHVFATYDEKSRLEAVLTQPSADNALKSPRDPPVCAAGRIWRG